MDIWKVSERAIFTIQRIVRVSPEPRFVSSVSRHCTSPQALTPRSFQPKKHDTDDGKESAWDRSPVQRQMGSSQVNLVKWSMPVRARIAMGHSDDRLASAITMGRQKPVSNTSLMHSARQVILITAELDRRRDQFLPRPAKRLHSVWNPPEGPVLVSEA